MNAVETLNLIGRPNAYYPNLAKPLGGVNAAVLFSQLFYWQDKAVSQFGVYKTRDELECETGLTHNEQRTAIKKLEAIGVLTVTEKRLDHKTFYKINDDKVNVILADFANSNLQAPRTLECNHPELDNVDIGETTNQSSSNQVITTKTTTKITSKEKIYKKDFDFSALTSPIDELILNDFIGYRKSIKKPVTQGAINHLVRELNKAIADGYSPDELIEMTLSRGWQTFEYRYINNQQSSQNNLKQTGKQFMTRSERNAEIMRSL